MAPFWLKTDDNYVRDSISVHLVVFIVQQFVAWHVMYFVTDGVYIGCFQDGCLMSDFNVTYDPETRNSPDNCNQGCRTNGYPYAGIHNRTRCSCFCEVPCIENVLQDDLCGIPCPGDIDHFCGGVREMSIYIGKKNV